MSLDTLWLRRAIATKHKAVLQKLRVVAAERVEHIMVSETKNSLGGTTTWGANSPLCSVAIDARDVLHTREFNHESPTLCDACNAKFNHCHSFLGLKHPKP